MNREKYYSNNFLLLGERISDEILFEGHEDEENLVEARAREFTELESGIGSEEDGSIVCAYEVDLMKLYSEIEGISSKPNPEAKFAEICNKVLGLENFYDRYPNLNNGKTLLHYGAQYAAINVVNNFVKLKNDLDCIDKYNKTPLYYAVFAAASEGDKQSSYLEIASALLAYGANPNIAPTSDTVALYWAIESKQMQLIRGFLEHGADVFLKDYVGYTVLENLQNHSGMHLKPIIASGYLNLAFKYKQYSFFSKGFDLKSNKEQKLLIDNLGKAIIDAQSNEDKNNFQSLRLTTEFPIKIINFDEAASESDFISSLTFKKDFNFPISQGLLTIMRKWNPLLMVSKSFLVTPLRSNVECILNYYNQEHREYIIANVLGVDFEIFKVFVLSSKYIHLPYEIYRTGEGNKNSWLVSEDNPEVNPAKRLGKSMH